MIKLFTCYHRPFQIPQSNIIVPIHAGKAVSTKELDFIGDNTHENISIKNPYYSELTAIYWVWKHVKDAHIIGIQHYRRFFNFRTNMKIGRVIHANFCKNLGITEDNILDILKEYDIILPKKHNFIYQNDTPKSIYEQYAESHFSKDMDIVLDIIAEKYPEISVIAENVIKEQSFLYLWNMQITTQAVFNEYASFLFSILFDLEKCIQKNVLTRDAYQQRAYAFMAERMMNIFVEYKIQRTGLKVKEVPIIFISEES